MLKIKNRLRILGTHEDVLEIKAFLDRNTKDDQISLDFTKITPSFKGEIHDVIVNYDTLYFTSNASVVSVIQDLSKRFDHVKFALQTEREETTDKGQMVISEVEKTHHVMSRGDIISESKSSSKHLETKQNDQAMLENQKEDEKARELVTKESLFNLQDRFFKDIQAFMKDFTESFFSHWF